jgi:hypothetical protein
MATQAHWEFLLQQEGDRSWLPLDTASAEILEGRYRIIARSNRYNVDVEVRITHENSFDQLPKRRTQKRATRTNGDGFLLVLPFTLMTPGNWSFRCSGDVMSDLLGQSWQQSVVLQVQPQVLADEGDWQPDWAAAEPAAIAATTAETTPEVTAEATPEPVASGELIASAMLEPIAEPIANPIAAPALPSTADPVAADLVALFDQTQWDEPPAVALPTPAAAARAEVLDQLDSLDDLFGDLTASQLSLVEHKVLPEVDSSFADLIASTDAPSAVDQPPPPEPDTELNFDLDFSLDGAGEDTAVNIVSSDGGDDALSDAPHTEMELVTTNDETLLDLNVPDWSLPDLSAPDLSAPAAPDLSSPATPSIDPALANYALADDELADDDLRMFEALFADDHDLGRDEEDGSSAVPTAATSPLLGSDDLADIDLSVDAADFSDAIPNDVLEFTDADALSMVGDAGTPIDLDFSGLELELDSPQTLPLMASADLAAPDLWVEPDFTAATDCMAEPIAAVSVDAADRLDEPPVLDEVIVSAIESPSPLPMAPPITPPSPAPIVDTLPGVWGMTTRVGASAAAVTAKTAMPPSVTAVTTPNPAIDNAAADRWVSDQRSTPVELAPVESTPVELAPVEPSLVELPPVEPSPVESAAAAPAPVGPEMLQLEPLPPLAIELQTSMYSFRRDQVLTIYGQVVPEQIPAMIDQGELVVKLIDPQMAAVVAEYRQPLQRQALPFAITAPLRLPSHLQAQLLVGEVAVWDDGLEALAQYNFTATADMATIMGAIDPSLDPATFETTPQPVPEPDSPLPPVDFSFFNLIGDAPEDAPEPAPLTKKESLADVALPALAVPSQADDEDLFSLDSLDLESMSASLLGEPEANDGANGIDNAVAVPDGNDLSVDADVAALIVEPGDAIAPELLTNLVQEPPYSIPEPEPEPEPEPPVPTETDPLMREVVVDDWPEALPSPQLPVAVAENPLLLAENEAVPEPIIQVEAGELVTGQAIRVKVQLPSILPKLYVKLWINDRQTRTLLDGPRWLVDFVPNGRDQLEAVTQLTVPFGSLEIQIAAIAVEASTKRESYRTAVDRAVVPPNMQDDLAEFDLDL